MIRLLILMASAFVLPFAAHGLVTAIRGRGFHPLPRRLRGRLWLVVAGLVMVAALLALLIGWTPHVLGERYVPAHMENGTFVPGRFE